MLKVYYIMAYILNVWKQNYAEWNYIKGLIQKLFNKTKLVQNKTPLQFRTAQSMPIHSVPTYIYQQFSKTPLKISNTITILCTDQIFVGWFAPSVMILNTSGFWNTPICVFFMLCYLLKFSFNEINKIWILYKAVVCM